VPHHHPTTSRPEGVGAGDEDEQHQAVGHQSNGDLLPPAHCEQQDYRHRRGQRDASFENQGRYGRQCRDKHRRRNQDQEYSDGSGLPPATPESEKKRPVVTDNRSASGHKHHRLRHSQRLGEEHGEGAFRGVDKAHRYADRRSQLSEGILGAHIAVAQPSNVAAAADAPGYVSGRNAPE
jgi:hypothetical protein